MATPSEHAHALATFVDEVVEKPSLFFMPDSGVAGKCRAVIKSTFDTAKAEELKPGLGPLPELYVAGFDTEQIWEEIHLQHTPVFQFLERSINRLLKKPHKVELPVPESDSDSDESELSGSDVSGGSAGDAGPGDSGDEAMGQGAGSGSDAEEEDDDSGSDAPDLDAGSGEEGSGSDTGADAGAGAGAGGGSGEAAPDRFFSLEDMERFVSEGEKAEEAAADAARAAGMEPVPGAAVLGDLDDVDMYAADADDDEDDPYGGPRFTDLFTGGAGGAGKGKAEDAGAGAGGGADMSDDEIDRIASGGAPSGFAEAPGSSDEEGGSDEEDAAGTAHARHQAGLKKTIAALEDEALAPKPWQLTGEVTADKRPENSLLEAVLEYQHAQRQAPTITVESTAALEDIIKQRIRDEAWDDPERKVTEQVATRELADVSQEKSKLGLGEIYEKEYAREAMGIEETDSKQVLRDEIKGLFAELNMRLDALSNFNFTPRPDMPEAEVTANAPAITMEEVIPTAVSDARLQAPEEVFRKKKGRDSVLVGEDELSKEDRKRRRQASKARKAKRRRQREQAEKLVAKINPGLGNKYAKAKMLRELKADKTIDRGTTSLVSEGANFRSSKFFANLQAQVDMDMAGIRKKSRRSEKKGPSAANYKL